MACGGTGSNSLYSGTVEHIVKSYGFIRLDGANPVPRAFFDKSSVGGAVDDLTKRFAKGCKIKAKIVHTDGEHKVKFKATAMRLANEVDSSIRGGDQYLKKYLEDNGATDLDPLLEELSEMSFNCPRFLRNADVEDIVNVVASRPDWFEIKDDCVCLVEQERSITDLLLKKMGVTNSNIAIWDAVNAIGSNGKLVRYLPRGEDSIKDFVSVNPDMFVFWDDHIWKRDRLLGDVGLNRKFQQDLKAVKYYSQFINPDFEGCVLPMRSLCGHWGQASEEVKKVVRPREAEFREFLERNSFFFELDDFGDIENCSDHRLRVIDKYWIANTSHKSQPQYHPLKSQFQTVSAKPIPCSPLGGVFPHHQYAPPTKQFDPFFGGPQVAQRPMTSNSFQERKLSSEAMNHYLAMSQLHPAMRQYVSHNKRGTGGEEYLEKYLPETGSKPVLQLIIDLGKNNDPFCPVYLKYGHIQDLCDIARDSSDRFSIREGFFCLNSLEDALVHDVYFEHLQNGRFPMIDLKSRISSNSQPGRYLFAPAKHPRGNIKDFIARNAKWFMAWENNICRYAQVVQAGTGMMLRWQAQCFEDEMRAVKYYSKFIEPEGTEIISLRGHYAQAPSNVRNACSANEEEFTSFLKRNYFFFDIANGDVKLGSKDRLEVIDKYWLNKQLRFQVLQSAPSKAKVHVPILAVQPSSQATSVHSPPRMNPVQTPHRIPDNQLFYHPQPQMNQILTRQRIPVRTPQRIPANQISNHPQPLMNPVLTPQRIPVRTPQRIPANQISNHPQPLMNPVLTPQRIPVQPTPAELPAQPIQISKAFSDMEAELAVKKNTPTQQASHAARLSFETSVHSQPSLLQSQDTDTGTPSTTGIFSLPEAQVFKKLVGDSVSRAIEDEIQRQDTLNSLILIRFNIGKPPMAKFRIPDEGGGFNHMLKTDPVKSEDLQKLLRNAEVIKMDTSSHYGVKGTLHSIRTMERAGKITALTLFCQLHEANDGLGLDIWKGKKLTAVFTGNYPEKYIYNYLRCKCETLSRRGDVLVIDVDGQLSGCEEQPHLSLGNVAKMLCSSSSELSQAITESIQHMHEYVVIIGIDATEHLKAVQRMCGKDTQVIAEVTCDLKSEVGNLFT